MLWLRCKRQSGPLARMIFYLFRPQPLQSHCVGLSTERCMRRYTVYGGSFDPVHCGHISLVERAVALGYDVIMVPAFRHAFGKQSAPFEHRVRMCELALLAGQLQSHAQVCTIERSLAPASGAPVYTYDVLCYLRDKLGSAPCLLVGPDISAEWERWYRHIEIDQEFGRLCLPLTH